MRFRFPEELDEEAQRIRRVRRATALRLLGQRAIHLALLEDLRARGYIILEDGFELPDEPDREEGLLNPREVRFNQPRTRAGVVAHPLFQPMVENLQSQGHLWAEAVRRLADPPGDRPPRQPSAVPQTRDEPDGTDQPHDHPHRGTRPQ